MKKEIRQKLETVTISYNVFIAEDGKEFKSKIECEKYEKELKGIKEKKLSDYDKIKCHMADYSDWYYIEDRNDFISFIKALKNNFYRASVYYVNADDYYGTWVSFTYKEDDYGVDIDLVSKKELESGLKDLEKKLKELEKKIDRK